jgi:YD repeat-containing protein
MAAYPIPAASGADPQVVLTYNSSLTGTIQPGWTHSFIRNVQSQGSTAATVNTETGTSYAYTNKNGTTGYYDLPAGAKNSLKGDANGWTETQPDGLAFRYNNGGKLQYLKAPGGGRWTLTQPPSPNIGIITPAGRRTTSNSGPGQVKSIQTADGRLTTLVYNQGGLLGALVDPTRQRVSMLYNNLLYLKSWQNAQGAVTTFLYPMSAAAGAVSTVVLPAGQRTTYRRKQRGQVKFYRQMRLTVRAPPAMTSLEFLVKQPNLTPLFSSSCSKVINATTVGLAK